MRGFVLNRLADFFGHSRMGWALAVIVHAIFFGLLHVYQGVPGIIGSGVSALIFASVYLLGKRRLLPVIIDAPRKNLTGDPYFTDGLRAILWVSSQPSAFSDVGWFDWEYPTAR